MDDCALGTLEGSGHVDLVASRLSLLPGCYSISAGILDPQGLRPLDLHARAYPFSVVSTRRDFGFVYLEHQWRHTARGAGWRQPRTPRPRVRRASPSAQEELQMIAPDVELGADVSIPQPELVNLYGCRVGDGHADRRVRRDPARRRHRRALQDLQPHASSAKA